LPQAANEAKLRVAGQPRITEKEGAPKGELAFDAVFEVYPEVKIGDLATAEVEKLTTEVTTRHRPHAGHPAQAAPHLRPAPAGRRRPGRRPRDRGLRRQDRRRTLPGRQGRSFQFLVGEGQMLKEFEDAVRGMKSGESKTFPLAFPADYHGKDVAGKTADFLVTVKKIEAAHLPEVNEALAKSLGIADATVEGLRADIKKNLEREVKFRLLARNKNAVMDALVAKAELDLPNASVQAEVDRMIEGARADLKQRGIKDADKAPIPDDVFRPQAERRVRLGLVVAELVRTNELHAKPEQVKAHVDELAASYEKPADVVRWYYSDTRRLAEVEAIVIENNVTEFVLSKAKTVTRQDDLV
jgi:trigger factor